MQERFRMGAGAAIAGLLIGLVIGAQAQSPGAGFSKRNYNFSAWTKGRFSELVTVTNPGRFITVAGIGAESEPAGKTMYPGDILAPCPPPFPTPNNRPPTPTP